LSMLILFSDLKIIFGYCLKPTIANDNSHCNSFCDLYSMFGRNLKVNHNK